MDPYFKALGLEANQQDETDTSVEVLDHKKLEEAYEKAHHIRKFEIDMYWRRSAYLWTIQAAALAGLAGVGISAGGMALDCSGPWYQLFPGQCASDRVSFLALVAIWLFGLFSAFIWFWMMKGAKFWQNNWERHVDYLESQVSGNLYKTYLVEPGKQFEKPYSVSKLNQAMAGFMIFLWVFVGIVVAVIMIENTLWQVMVVLTVAAVFVPAWLFDPCLRMSAFGEPYQTGARTRGSEPRFLVLRKSWHTESAPGR